MKFSTFFIAISEQIYIFIDNLCKTSFRVKKKNEEKLVLMYFYPGNIFKNFVCNNYMNMQFFFFLET